MRKILKNKKGVTILEGLIALMLLALVATGTFAVLLSTSRKSVSPDIREEMALAVERASQLLQAYVYPENTVLASDVQISGGLCGGDSSPLAAGSHNIPCLLPPVCDSTRSVFSYTVAESSLQPNDKLRAADRANESNLPSGSTAGKLQEIQFEIVCNGFSL